MYSSTVKSFRRQGTETAPAIFFQILVTSKKPFWFGQYRNTVCPCHFIVLCNLQIWKLLSNDPLDGEAFLHSQIKESPGFLIAFSNVKFPFGRDNACCFNSSSDILNFACPVRSRRIRQADLKSSYSHLRTVADFNELIQCFQRLTRVNDFCGKCDTLFHTV